MLSHISFCTLQTRCLLLLELLLLALQLRSIRGEDTIATVEYFSLQLLNLVER